MARASSAPEPIAGPLVVDAARLWIGTPYMHRTSCRGGGTDCLGLIRGVWRELLGAEPEIPPLYTPDWGEVDRQEVLWRAAERHLLKADLETVQNGDVVLMRMQEGGMAKHLGVRATGKHGYPTLIHAYSGHGVLESPLTPAWSRKIVAAFRFPDRRI